MTDKHGLQYGQENLRPAVHWQSWLDTVSTVVPFINKNVDHEFVCVFLK
jgi:hypothetical protein